VHPGSNRDAVGGNKIWGRVGEMSVPAR
jgi:hypothetical protein